MKHFISISDTATQDLLHVLEVGFALRAQRQTGRPHATVLAGRTLAMIFEKPSLRTRVSFQQAMYELGGQVIAMSDTEVGLGRREPAADVARVLSGMVQGIVARVFEHGKLEELAAHATIPVVNALSDYSHPCQALADAMTVIDEFGHDLRGRTLAFFGDGNNVARSLAVLCGKLGMNFVIAGPPRYQLESSLLQRLRGQLPGVSLKATSDPSEAVRQADVVYTDTWVSMGQEAEAAERERALVPFHVNAALLAQAPAHAIVLHCLPAYRGEEITQDVFEGPRSRIFPQAHNRLHAQKGLLATLMGGA